MTICAVVDSTTGVVANKIMADPSDIAPEGCELVLIPEGVMCDIGWVWDCAVFVDPNPQEVTDGD